MGSHLEFGTLCCDRDRDLGFEYYHKAADRGDPIGMYFYGAVLADELDFDEQGNEWRQKAFATNNNYVLACCFFLGKTVKRDQVITRLNSGMPFAKRPKGKSCGILSKSC